MRKGLLALIGCLFLTGVYAQESGPTELSLSKAREYATRHSFAVRSASMDQALAKKQLNEIVAQGLPQISGAAQYQDYLEQATNLLPAEMFGGPAGEMKEMKFGMPHNANWSVTANQLIFNGSYIVGVQTAAVFKQLSEQGLQMQETEAGYLVTDTYYLALLARENCHILDSSRINLESIFLETKARWQEGFVEETDVDQLQISLTELENKTRSAERQYQITLQLLKYQMGLEQETPIRLTDQLSAIIETVNLELLVARQFQYNQNIQYQMAETREQLARKGLENERMAYLPSLNAFATYQESAQMNEMALFDSQTRWLPMSVVGVQLNVPLFSGGARLSKVSQARIELEKAQLGREQMAESLKMQAVTAQYNLKTGYEQMLNSSKNLALNKKVYGKTLEKYREGVASGLDLVQVHNSYLETEANYIASLAELLKCKNELDKLNN